MQTNSLKYCALAMGMALPVFVGAQALEQARVVSSTPIVQQFSVPQQVCSKVQVFVPTPNTGAGALAGAIVGGAIGNSLGHGAGSAAATALGVIGGAILIGALAAGIYAVCKSESCAARRREAELEAEEE